MLQFDLDTTQAELILTLTEYVTIPTPYYLFVFTHATTKDEVKFIKAEIDDESEYPNRFNKFTINPATVFQDQQPGEWHYKVYQQDSPTNIDINLTAGILEYGKLILDRASDFSFTMYEQAQTFKTYNG